MTTTPTTPTARRSLGDTATLTGRSMRHVLRSPDTIITTAVTPVALLLLFVYVFGGAIDTGGEEYVDYLLPGILLITVASGISYTAYRLFTDVSSGIFERFQSMPIVRSSVLWAHVLTSVVANLLALALVVLVALVLALTWLAVIPGLTATSVDGVSGFSYPLIFLPFVSSAFVPTDGMPSPVAWFAEHQPVTSIVDTLRHLFAEQPVGTEIWTALAWCVGLLVVSYALAMRVYHRAVA
jgi:ABC-2 type transport system permease protein